MKRALAVLLTCMMFGTALPAYAQENVAEDPVSVSTANSSAEEESSSAEETDPEVLREKKIEELRAFAISKSVSAMTTKEVLTEGYEFLKLVRKLNLDPMIHGTDEQQELFSRYMNLRQQGYYLDENGEVAYEVPELEILEQPCDGIGKMGETITLQVQAVGDGLSYQWQVRPYADSAWEDYACTEAVNTMTLTEDLIGRQFRVIVRDQKGAELESDAVEVWDTECKAYGTCGHHAIWYLSDDGELTIRGEYDVLHGADESGWGAVSDQIRTVEIWGGITSLPKRAFRDCSNLTRISIPASVEEIGKEAFRGCYSLSLSTVPERFRKGTCGKDMTWELDKNAILTISGSGRMTSSPWNIYMGLIDGIRFEGEITSIAAGAFAYEESLRSVKLPESLEKIGAEAFKLCQSLSSIVIPDHVTSIGADAFNHCKGVEELILPKSLQTVGERAFYYCEILNNIYYKGTQKEWEQISIGKENDALAENEIHYESPNSNTFRITAQPEDVRGHVGEKISLKVEATGDNLSYQWYVMSKGDSGWKKSSCRKAVNSTVLNEAADGRRLYVEVTDGSGEVRTSNIVVLHVIPDLKITEQPQSVSGKWGDYVGFRVAAEGEDLTYQWFWRQSETDEWQEIASQSDEFWLTIYTSYNGRQIFARVTDKYGNHVDSDIATFTVVEAFRILALPEDVQGPVGQRVTVSINAAGEGLTYQWYVRDSDNDEWRVSKCKKAENSTVLTKSADGRQLYVVVTDKYGESYTSDPVTLKVTSEKQLKITQQPQDVYGTVGEQVTLKVEAEGNDLTYQWFIFDEDSAEWKKSTRTTAENSTKPNAAADGRQLYVRVTDKYGNSLDSDTVTLHVSGRPLQILTQPQSFVSGNLGQKITLKVEAQGDGLTYQWYVRDSESDSWRKSNRTKASNTTKLNAAADGRQLYVTVTDAYGNSIDSNISTLHVE